MANISKYNRYIAANIIGHNARQHRTYSNSDVDLSQSHENITYFDLGYAGYKERLAEVYCLKRKNVNTLAEVIVTQPKEFNRLAADQQDQLWKEVIDFLKERYGSANAIQAVVHKDEGGQPHLHFCFLPIVPDKKRGGEKICFDEKCSRMDYRTFHGDLEGYMTRLHQRQGSILFSKKDPIQALLNEPVGYYYHTGITAAQGGNWNVKDIKHEGELNSLKAQLSRAEGRIKFLDNQLASAKEKVKELEGKYAKEIQQDMQAELELKRKQEKEYEITF